MQRPTTAAMKTSGSRLAHRRPPATVAVAVAAAPSPPPAAFRSEGLGLEPP